MKSRPAGATKQGTVTDPACADLSDAPKKWAGRESEHSPKRIPTPKARTLTPRLARACRRRRSWLSTSATTTPTEAARILVSSEHHCILAIDLAHGHSVLAGARGGEAWRSGGETGGYFGWAMEAAKASCFPLVEVVTARGWGRAVGGDERHIVSPRTRRSTPRACAKRWASRARSWQLAGISGCTVL
jgi:hypothetical protein